MQLTTEEKEYLGFGIAGAALLLAAMSNRKGGLGQAGVNGQIVLQGTSQVVTNVQPLSNVELQVSGVTAADYIETNLDITGNSLNPNWTPSYTKPALTGEDTPAPGLPSIVWQKVGTVPKAPGQYTVLVSINGNIVLQLPLTVSSSGAAGSSGGYGIWNFPIITPAQTRASAAKAAQQLAASSGNGGGSGGGGNGSGSSAASSNVAATPIANQPLPAVVQTVGGPVGSTATTASPITNDLGSLLTGTMFGLPTWLVLGGGVLAVYLMTRK